MRSPSLETIFTAVALGTSAGLLGVSNAFSTSVVRNQITTSTALSATSSGSRRHAFFQGAGVLASAVTLVGAGLTSNPASCSAAVEDGLQVGGKPVKGSEAIMSQKAHGTTEETIQDNLRFGASRKTANKICSFNRRFAEYATYYQKETNFEQVVRAADGPVTFYDSVSGKPLYRAPIGRSVDSFLAESATHGWPSFRDQEVVWENVRVLGDGETVSTVGTHLGHNLPDRNGNRYCINVVCIAGNPTA